MLQSEVAADVMLLCRTSSRSDAAVQDKQQDVMQV
jgi:hypothetical protein